MSRIGEVVGFVKGMFAGRDADRDMLVGLLLVRQAKMMTRLVTMFLVVIPCCVVRAQDAPLIQDTPEAACEVLKVHMAKVEGLPGGKPYPRWFCDGPTVPDNKLVYIIGLRTAPGPEDFPPGDKVGYSQLVGWFAVARKSSLVFEYDINEERLIPISRAYYKRPVMPKPNRTATPKNPPPNVK